MKIGLWDIDGHNYPNLVLMKLSAWHKQKGDEVSLISFPTIEHFDRVYASKVFGDEYSNLPDMYLNTDEIIFGGTGFCITIENGREVFHKEIDVELPQEIEHIYPDYGLYGIADTAYGFLTRGCPNSCGFCIVSKKEGQCSRKVADLSEFWNGQKHIELLDPNILACHEKMDLLAQLADSGAKVNFSQGLDARFITPQVAQMLSKINIAEVHFAFDFMKNEKAIVQGLKTFQEYCPTNDRKATVYMLTNYDTTLTEDIYRTEVIKSLGYKPDIRIYRKSTASRSIRDLQGWCNNRLIYRTCKLEDFIPRVDGKTFKELYLNQ